MPHSAFQKLDKEERASTIGFLQAEALVQTFTTHEKELDRLGVTMDQWVRRDPKWREFKLESARKMMRKANA